MRIAVVGCGYWGWNHVRTLKELGHTVLCVDHDTKRLDALSSYTGAPAFYDADYVYKYEGVGAAVVAVPHEFLAQEALKAVTHKIPCLVEKPMATSSFDAWKLWAASKEQNVLVMPGFIERFNPLITDTKNFCSWRYGPDCNREVVWDLLIHDIDLAYYLGAEVATFECGYTDGWKWRSVNHQHTFHDGELLKIELSHFLNCVQGKEKPRVTVEDGVRAVVAAEIIQSVSANAD